MSKKVFFTGASGVGKTTLVNWVSASFGMPKYTDTLRKIADQYGGYEAIHKDANTREKFQSSVFDQICKIGDIGDVVVTDRSPTDVVAYSARYSQGTWLLNDERLAKAMQAMRDGVVFFVRPHPVVLAAAVASGDRRKYTETETAYGLDGGIQVLLELFNVPHVQVAGSEFSDRCRTVATTLHLAGFTAKNDSWSQPGRTPTNVKPS